ncbi:MAG: DMT family transporter [Aquincola sp.]|nr:DMT family transporter [Aquincola sp.]MDH4287312.1 DMT family transporter [Aquincola sp.]MDH5328355.1 DMT family transporter [Aquincola sp.]
MITRRQLTLLAVLTVLWGCNWPMMKLSLREVGPLWFRAITMCGGVVLLGAWVAARGARLAPRRDQWAPLLALALPNIVGWHLCSIIGLTLLPAGRAGILAFTMPVWTVLLGAALFRQPLTRGAWAASACALVAVALLGAQELTTLAGRPTGVLWLQAAAASWALGTLLLRRSAIDLSPEAVTVWMMALGGVIFVVLAATAEPLPAIDAWSDTMWAAMVWGTVVNFGISQAIWFGLARALTPQASTFSLMAVPLVGVASATFVVSEVPRATDWVAALFIAAAIASATRSRGDNARP